MFEEELIVRLIGFCFIYLHCVHMLTTYIVDSK